MIPPSSASDRLTSILGNAEWVVRRNERANDPFAGRERASVREEANKLVWSGTLSLARRGRGASDEDDDDDDDDVTTTIEMSRWKRARTRASRAATRSRSEAVDETAGTTLSRGRIRRARRRRELGGGERRGRVGHGRATRDGGDRDARRAGWGVIESARGGAEDHCVSTRRARAAGDGEHTGNGEGRGRRARAAGSALPEIVHAECVAPGDDGWPEVWDPVALLRLFPSSAHHATAFRRIHALLADCRSDHTKSDDPESVVPAAARMGIFRTGTSCSSSRTRVCRTSCATPSV